MLEKIMESIRAITIMLLITIPIYLMAGYFIETYSLADYEIFVIAWLLSRVAFGLEQKLI